MSFPSRKLTFALFFLVLTVLSGCRIGEDDPLLSLRTRDARLKNTWRLRQMQSETKINQFDQGSTPVETVVSVSYDSQDLKIVTKVNDAVVNDTTIGFAYIMEVLDRGKVVYTTTVIQQGLGVKGGGEDSWFWLNDDRRKSRVYLGNALQFTQLAATTLSSQPFFTEFEIKELRNDLLRLSLRKRIEQTGLNGNFQELEISSDFEFRPN
jgi:hypothetical protein